MVEFEDYITNIITDEIDYQLKDLFGMKEERIKILTKVIKWCKERKKNEKKNY